MSYTWLITGASSGLGTSMAMAALNAGHKVLAGARTPAKARQDYPDIEKLGGVWLQLDVTQPDVEQVVSQAVSEHSVNVLVNNAGYAERGVVEDLSIDQFRAQFETNFFGMLAVTKGAIPAFRARQAGSLVFISSVAGLRGGPGYAAYASSKFAMEGAAEALSHELAPFGVRVLLVEPGGFRTNFQRAAGNPTSAVSAPYAGGPAEQRLRRNHANHGAQPGHPDKAAAAILDAVTGAGAGADAAAVLRLPLGRDAVEVVAARIEHLQDVRARVGHIAEAAVFDD